MGNDAFQLHRRDLRLLLKTYLVLVLSRVSLILHLFCPFELFLLRNSLLVEIVLELEAIFIAPEVEIIDGHENFAQVQVLHAEFLVASLHFRLDFILLFCSFFDLP